MYERLKIEEAELKYPHRWLKLQDTVWRHNVVLLEDTIVDVRDIEGLTWDERTDDEINGFVWWYTSPMDLDNIEERCGIEISG